MHYVLSAPIGLLLRESYEFEKDCVRALRKIVSCLEMIMYGQHYTPEGDSVDGNKGCGGQCMNVYKRTSLSHAFLLDYPASKYAISYLAIMRFVKYGRIRNLHHMDPVLRAAREQIGGPYSNSTLSLYQCNSIKP